MFAFSINIDAEKLKKAESGHKSKKKGSRKQDKAATKETRSKAPSK